MPYQTLGELRATLSARLGFGASGAATGINKTLLDSFLQDAQKQLYQQFDWRHMTTFDEKLTGIGQTLYDYPVDCDIERILNVAVWDGVWWQPMEEGITWNDRSLTSVKYIPTRYERFFQFEIWPEPDEIYTIRRYYVKLPSRFTQDNDRATVNDDLVFLHAMVNAKLHYRQPDGNGYASQLQAMIDKIKSRSRPSQVRQRGGPDSVYPIPKVV